MVIPVQGRHPCQKDFQKFRNSFYMRFISVGSIIWEPHGDNYRRAPLTKANKNLEKTKNLTSLPSFVIHTQDHSGHSHSCKSLIEAHAHKIFKYACAQNFQVRMRATDTCPSSKVQRGYHGVWKNRRCEAFRLWGKCGKLLIMNERMGSK